MIKRKRLIGLLVFLALLDTVLPIPFFAIAAIYIIVKRPVEFLDFVRRLYTAK